MQFDEETLPKALEEHGLDKVPINHVYLGGNFMCSSSEVVNGVFDQIGRCVIKMVKASLVLN